MTTPRGTPFAVKITPTAQPAVPQLTDATPDGLRKWGTALANLLMGVSATGPRGKPGVPLSAVTYQNMVDLGVLRQIGDGKSYAAGPGLLNGDDGTGQAWMPNRKLYFGRGGKPIGGYQMQIHLNDGTNLVVGDPVSVAGSVVLAAVNDDNSANTPLEIRAAKTWVATGTVQIGTGALTYGGGLLSLSKATSVYFEISLNGGKSLLMGCDSGDPFFGTFSGHNLSFRVNNTTVGGWLTNGNFVPWVDNTWNCGQGSNRWGTIFASNGTINTSDAREKTDVVPLPIGLDFVCALKPVTFRWIVGGNTVEKTDDPEKPIVTPRPGRRTHAGLLAQDVKAALDGAGIDLGMWTIDDPADQASRQGLRYDQLVPVLIRAVQELALRVQVLEARTSNPAPAP